MRAVFFDRDGTLIEDAHYLGDPGKVRVFPGVPEALAALKHAGFGVFVVSNQSGIGRGLITHVQYHAVHSEFLLQIGPGLIDASYFCPDAPGADSSCRKPEPGMLLRAASEHGIDLTQSFMVGDKAADVECGQRAGTRTILVRTGYGAEQVCAADWVCADAVEAVQTILTATSRP
jgi:D-glycero-D-manno-heptose 1,7-bisphosphate phosphatase